MARAQSFVVEVQTGGSVHAPNDLHVDQSGHPSILVSGARYATRPFVRPYNLASLTESYYSVRVGFEPSEVATSWGTVAYELEWLHDKAYLVTVDPLGVVDHYELSDGLNQLLFGVSARWTDPPLLLELLHARLGDGGLLDGALDVSSSDASRRVPPVDLVVRIGVGPVIVAPATVVRGLEDGTRTHRGVDAYYALAGPGAQVATQARVWITPFVGVSSEFKATVARVAHPIADGTARATFHGAHATFGVTFAWP